MGLFGRDSQSSTPPTSQTTRPAKNPSPAAAKTTIAQGSQVEGRISGAADLLIQGEVKGTIHSSGLVFVSESGVVDASIRARSISVAGRVIGNLAADDLIELEPGGVVHGDLLSPRILIKDGANLQGQVEMSKPPTADQPRKPTADEKRQGDKQENKATEKPEASTRGSKQAKKGR